LTNKAGPAYRARMKNKYLAASLAAMACLVLAGCEADSVSSRISVTPSSATIRKGQSLTFHAEGGYDYQWSLSDHSLGVLSAATGDSVTYTSIYEPAEGSTAVQVLTCSSFVEGQAGSNDAPSEWTAEVYITHVR